VNAAPRTTILAGALLCAALAAASSARAQSGAPTGALGLSGQDSNKPLHIEAQNGVEWQQVKRVYIARGHAKVTRGDTSVTADTLYAYYRPSQAPTATSPNGLRSDKPAEGTNPFDSGSTQIYRIDADGSVVLATPTQSAYGDHAVYDVDQAVMVLTGKNLRIVTPQDTITARDSLEWFDQKQIGVARGNAVAVRTGPPQKSIRGDVLTAELTKHGDEPSKISKVNAQGHVVLTSQDEIARGDAAVYNLETGIATITGHVAVTRGDNELRGEYAVVDTNTNIARLLATPPSAKLTGPQPRVEGLLVPRPQDQTAKPKP